MYKNSVPLGPWIWHTAGAELQKGQHFPALEMYKNLFPTEGSSILESIWEAAGSQNGVFVADFIFQIPLTPKVFAMPKVFLEDIYIYREVGIFEFRWQ